MKVPFSPSIHSVLAAELGKKDKAVELYERTARLDLDNYNNDTVDGLHYFDEWIMASYCSGLCWDEIRP